MTTLTYSPLESARFGLRIYRAMIDAVDADALVAALDRDRVDVAILRLPAHAIGTLDALRQHGLTPIVADTLVHYDIDLSPRSAGSNADDAVALRVATSADAGLLESLSREIFSDYVTHYHANPLFPADKILDGYAEWASNHVRARDDGAAAWIVEFRGETAGFSCYRLNETTGLAVGVLNGILPALRDRGIYRRMLQSMLIRVGELGMRRFAIATQVQNVAVQRIWASQGLLLRGADNTVHINALRAQSNATRDDVGADSPKRVSNMRASAGGGK